MYNEKERMEKLKLKHPYHKYDKELEFEDGIFDQDKKF